MLKWHVDVKTIRRAAKEAETKVKTYTTPACAFTPEGIFQTMVP